MDLLCTHYSKTECIFTGRASAGIFLALKALNKPGTGVIVPAITCHAAVFPVILAGYKPIFCDVEFSDFNCSISKIESAAQNEDVTACLFVHSFGHKKNIFDLSNWARNRGIFLIEDVCQLFGDACCRYYGDLIVTSFGSTKVCDIGGGGALLSNDPEFLDDVKLYRKTLPAEPQGQVQFRSDYFNLRLEANVVPDNRVKIFSLAEKYRDLFIHDDCSWKSLIQCLISQIENIRELVEIRRSRFESYLSNLGHLPGVFPKLESGSVPWRFTFLTPGSIPGKILAQEVRRCGGHASNWYPSVALDFGLPYARFPNAKQVEERIVNLWLMEGVSDKDVKRDCETIKEFL